MYWSRLRLVVRQFRAPVPTLARSVCLCVWMAGVLALAGCVDQPARSTTSSPAPGAETVAAAPAASPVTYVLATGTVYYAGDPQHGHKPDGTFRRGTKVSLLHRAGNYSLVRSEDGVEAYVATHILEPLAMQ